MSVIIFLHYTCIWNTLYSERSPTLAIRAISLITWFAATIIRAHSVETLRTKWMAEVFEGLTFVNICKMTENIHARHPVNANGKCKETTKLFLAWTPRRPSSRQKMSLLCDVSALLPSSNCCLTQISWALLPSFEFLRAGNQTETPNDI